ncbi:MAG: MFS transporter [Clostridiales bacterium]|nr:MFS transporter [Clostridiales bacterium]
MVKKEYTYKHTTYACYRGYITQAIINNLIPLFFYIFHSTFDINYEQLAFLIIANFATQLIADIWATKYADRVGYRKCMVAAHGLSFIGFVLLGTLPLILSNAYTGLIISVIVYALGGGLLEVIVSPIIEALPNKNKEGSMSLLHSFYCWGQMSVVFISTFIIWIIGTDMWFILPLLWSLFPLYNMFKFLHVPILPLVEDGKGMNIKELFSSPSFYLFIILMICAGASELTMSQWSSFFAEKGLGLPKLLGDLLGPGLFALYMAIGRVLYGLWGNRIPIKKTLIISSLLCVITYLVTVFSPYPLLSLISCSLTGITVALMWPGTFSLSSAKFPRGGTLMFGILAICGDIGCSVGPWITGLISDHFTKNENILEAWPNMNLDIEQLAIRTGLLVAIIFPLMMLIGLLLARKNRRYT